MQNPYKSTLPACITETGLADVDADDLAHDGLGSQSGHGSAYPQLLAR